MGKAHARPKTTRAKQHRSEPRASDAVPAASRRSDWRTPATVAMMILAVIAVYVPIPSAEGNALWGADFFELHYNRIRFAQAALFGAHSHLPAWYPRELMGTPFWSNIQSFPFLPTRLVLLALDPLTLFPVAVILGASLAALFTFLYARRLGLSRPAAAVAGWTFACAGFYASRVMAGHLPLLEVYGALPLLLWLVERCRVATPGRQRSLAMLALGAACAGLALAGHPQLPVYAGAAALVYAFVRLPVRTALRAATAMAAGVLCAGFVVWPMFLLIGRSTRVLPLDPPSNDIAYPYARLVSVVLPWRQGWPAAVVRSPRVPLAFPDDAYFWETVDYVGLLPLAAAAFLAARAVAARKRPAAAMTFLIVLGASGALLAFPAARAPFSHLPGTFMRSPARLFYFAEFGLAIGLGAALDLALARAATPGWRWVFVVVAFALLAHGLDLGAHDRQFIRMVPSPGAWREREERFAQAVGDGRVAIDVALVTPLNRELDDIGYFDSIALARPYRALLDLSALPPPLNTQYLDGSELNARALRAGGVKVVLTSKFGGAGRAAPGQPIPPIPILNPSKRVQFFPDSAVEFLGVEPTHRNLRDERFDLQRRLMLPPEARPAAAADATRPATGPAPAPPAIEAQYDDDQITTAVKANEPGYLCWLDTWDPGWHATLDGAPAPIEIADDVFMALRVPPGVHTVRLNFSTPGAGMGGLLSLIGAVALAAVCLGPWVYPRKAGHG